MVQAQVEALLREAFGLDAASIGSPAIERAVEARQQACKQPDPLVYWEHLRTSAAELQALIEAVVVSETWFFRDRGAFTALARLAHDEWLPTHADDMLRVLSLPCSTGEEPYSAAIALLEAGLSPERFRIDAIDISTRALSVAERAVYGRNSFRGSDLSFRQRHFTATPQGMRLHGAVRRQVRFWQGNLLAPGFSPGADSYDAIFCRNLLIYFDRAAQDRTVGLLERLLTGKGTLFVGPSEAGLLLAHGFTSARLPMAFAFHKTGAAPTQAKPARRARVAAAPPSPPALRPLQPWPNRPVAPSAPRQASAASPPSDIAEATRLADQGRLAEAAHLCEQHLRLHGASAQAFYLLGLIRDASGNPQDAVQYYRKVLYLDSNHADALFHLALLLEKQGDAAAARRLRERTRRRVAAESGPP